MSGEIPEERGPDYADEKHWTVAKRIDTETKIALASRRSYNLQHEVAKALQKVEDTALASRAATTKTQGEEIAELRASVESKTAAIGAALEQMHGEDWAWCIPEIKAGLSAAFCSAPLAPGAKSAREVKQ